MKNDDEIAFREIHAENDVLLYEILPEIQRVLKKRGYVFHNGAPEYGYGNLLEEVDDMPLYVVKRVGEKKYAAEINMEGLATEGRIRKRVIRVNDKGILREMEELAALWKKKTDKTVELVENFPYEDEETRNLLGLLEETFYGSEKTHSPMEWDIEYSPKTIRMHRKHPAWPEEVTTEIRFDEDYNVTYYAELYSGGRVKNYTTGEIKKLEEYGTLANQLKHDPRYILRNAKGIRKMGDTYHVKVFDNLLDAAEGLLGKKIEQAAEIVFDGDKLKKMRVKNIFGESVEKTFTEIDFWK